MRLYLIRFAQSGTLAVAVCAMFATCSRLRSGVEPVADLADFEGHGVVSSLQFSPDNRYLAAALSDIGPGTLSTVVIWEPCEKKIVASRRFPEHELWPTALCYSPDAMHLIVGQGKCHTSHAYSFTSGNLQYASEGRLLVLDAATLNEVKRVDVPWSIYNLLISPNGKEVLATGADKRSRIHLSAFDLNTLEERKSRVFDGRPVPFAEMGSRQTMAYLSDGKHLLVATQSSSQDAREPSEYSDGIVHVLDSESLEDVAIWTLEHAPVTTIVVGGNRILFGHYKSFSLWTLNRQRLEIANVDLPTTPAGAPVAWLSRSKLVPACSPDPTGPYPCYLWDPDGRNVLKRYLANTSKVCSAAVSPSEEYVAVGGAKGGVFVWNLDP